MILYQLKPVKDGYIFQPLWGNYGPLARNMSIEHFSMYGLSKIMGQKDKMFTLRYCWYDKYEKKTYNSYNEYNNFSQQNIWSVIITNVYWKSK